METMNIRFATHVKKDKASQGNRELFRRRGTMVLHIIGSPGSGTTTLLERTIEELRGRVSIGVIEADPRSDVDGKRIEAHGIPVVQIVANGGMHIDARMVRTAMEKLRPHDLELLMIENISSLLSTTEYDLGESIRAIMMSVTEGDDKPARFADALGKASVLILNKMDLLPFVQCDIEAMKRQALSVNPDLRIFETSCMLGHDLRDWTGWLLHEVRKLHDVVPA